MSADFTPGQRVHIKSLKKNGIVKAMRRNNKVQVQVGSLTLSLPISDVSPLQIRKKKSASGSKRSSNHSQSRARSSTRRTVDLHGLTTDQALERVECSLNNCLLDGVHELDIIHGIGQGILKAAVHRYLPGQKVVAHFTLVPGNPGTTRVYL